MVIAMKPTIKDVAREAGVSVSTISYAINKTRPISEETCRRIQEAIEKIGYSPNITARSLRTSKTKMIGIIIVDIQKSAFLSFFRHAENYLSEHGYSVILCNLDHDILEKGKQYVDLLLCRGVDGVIVTGNNTLAEYIRSLTDMPIIAVRKASGSSFTNIYCDTGKGSYLAAKELFLRNPMDLHVFTPAPIIPTYLDRMSGVFQAADEMKIDANCIQTHICKENSIEQGYLEMEALFENGILPRTVFATNDELAIGVLRSCIMRKINVPEEVSIIGFDDIPSASAVTPTLASVQFPMSHIGQVAASELISSIEGRKPNIHTICIEPTLILNRGTF